MLLDTFAATSTSDDTTFSVPILVSAAALAVGLGSAPRRRVAPPASDPLPPPATQDLPPSPPAAAVSEIFVTRRARR